MAEDDSVTPPPDLEMFSDENIKKNKGLPDNLRLQLLQRPLTHADFYYLLSRYPYLILSNADKAYDISKSTPKEIKANSGWVILDYGDVLCTSAGRLNYGSYYVNQKRDDDDDDGGSGGEALIDGTGSLQQQSVDTAFAMIAIAMERGWSAAMRVAGFYGMERAAWIAAKSQGYELKGFEPSNLDQVVYDLVSEVTPNRLKKARSTASVTTRPRMR